ncbi:DnaJ subfamily B member 9 [Tetrabaena socialis]|uniref:DnaJ subfamily B member 9 n=1 Tax=Tetrabaena socialis TaxID=47790 RepID=A0A2J8A5Y8_9CHLO|nr:DnaJ subfamily B member 9 [Tetrabaena socialis]|eukprot:PNH07941.1 DnaJ subfamily B member 9 [Tetrabaena socialis]
MAQAALLQTFYEVLGVAQAASDRDIKAAYRKLAMKLHPDVNRAPDAQKRFMEVKVAYETLSDGKQRAEYDRRLRTGYGGSSSGSRAGSRAGSGYGGGSSSSSAGGGWGSYGSGPGFTQEPLPNLDDLIRELEREFTAWATQQGRGGKDKSLMDELEDLGGELLDFLEESLGIKDEAPAGASSSSSRGGGASSSSSGGGAGAAREPRTAAEQFDALWQQYGDGSTSGATNGKTTGNGRGGSSGAQGGGRAAGAGSAGGGGSSGTGAGTGRAGSSAAGASSPAPQRQPPARSADEDIDAQLLALKRKLNKL